MKFQLTAVFIEDEKSKGYTAFFAEFPNIISEGKDLEQARELLDECFQLAIKDIGKRELKKHSDQRGILKYLEFTETPVPLPSQSKEK